MRTSFRNSLVLLFATCWAFSSAANSTTRGQEPLATQIQALLDEPVYRQAHWGLLFVDLKSGDVVFEHNCHKLFAPASVTKIFSTSAALDGLGADYRFQTPVFARGEIDAQGKLTGDLILRASGDPTLGGRTNDKGALDFTDSDHTYANWSGEAGLTPQDPLTGLNDLARQVHASGIRAIDGEVLIDDRLFETAEGSGSGPKQVSPIMVNDNVIDLVFKPGEVGKPAEITWRPHCSLLRVESRVETIAAGGKAETFIRDHDGLLTITGKVPADKQPVVRIQEVTDAAGWARSLFIDALERAGITVSCRPSLKHPPQSLPAANQYAELKQVAELKSLPFAENAKLILKVSHNLHASELPLLLAASKGKRTLADGMKLQREFLQRCGLEVDTISFGGGAGGARADYVTPHATVQLLQHLANRNDFAAFEKALPIMGVDGTLAKTVKPDSPVRGKVQAKTGTLVWDNVLNDRGLITSKALAGYLTTASGKRLAFAAFVNGVHARDGVDSKKVGSDLGRLCELVHRGKVTAAEDVSNMTESDVTCRFYSAAMLAELTGIETWRIRNWQRRGWLRPSEQQHRVSYFDFAEVAVARQLAQLHQAGASPKQIQEQLRKLQRAAPHLSRPMAELGVVLDGRQILLRSDAGLIEPGGQKRFEFGEEEAADEAPATILSPAQFLATGGASSTPATTLAEWALQLDEQGDLSGAMDLLRAALAASGPSAEWSFQLAEMLYRQGDLSGARERYYGAIELDEDFVEARANLGCVLAEQGQTELAIAALEGAILHHPNYADAHFHLARLLDEAAAASDAETHWQRFLELAPESPWAEEALQRLEAARL